MVAVARPSTEVRAMRREDLDAVVAIEHASYEFPWSAGIFRDCMQAGHNCWVIVHEGDIAGYGILCHQDTGLGAMPTALGGHVFLSAAVGGIVGALVDSVLGAVVQAQWRDGDRLVESRPVDGVRPVRGFAWVGNDCVNFVSTAVAVAVAWLPS